MNNNLPINKESGLFIKIKNFFRSLFFKSKQKNINERISLDIDKEKNNKDENFKKNIHVELDNEIQKKMEKEKLFQNIRNNPESLKSLSNDQLEKLSQYYSEKIADNYDIINSKNMEIEKLKKVG